MLRDKVNRWLIPSGVFVGFSLVGFLISINHLQQGEHSRLKVTVTPLIFNMDSKIMISNDMAKSKLRITYISVY